MDIPNEIIETLQRSSEQGRKYTSDYLNKPQEEIDEELIRMRQRQARNGFKDASRPYDAKVEEYFDSLHDTTPKHLEYDDARVLFYRIWKHMVGKVPFIYEQDTWIVRELVHWMIRDGAGNYSPYKGIILVGTYGCGKTTLLQAAKLFMEKYTGQNFAFRRVNDILIEVAKKGNIEAIEKYFTGHLILDDIGQMDENVMLFGSRYNIIETIINRRVGTQYITLATTNLKREEIRERYGPVVASRFNQMFTPLFFQSTQDCRIERARQIIKKDRRSKTGPL